MSDCRFGVSPVNYPDPDPEGEGEHIVFGVDPVGVNIGVSMTVFCAYDIS